MADPDQPEQPDQPATPTARAARSLADELRRRDDDELAALLRARPDLARPVPSDVTTLAARATTRASIQRALEGLDLARLQTLEAVVVAGPARPADVAALLGQPARSRRVAALLADLGRLALVWRSPEGYRAPRGVHEVVGNPAGLAPPEPAPPEGAATPALVRAMLSGLDRAERAVLDALTWGPPTGVLGPGGSGDRAVERASRSLLERGLLVRTDPEHVLLPRAVALVLRGGRLHRQPALEPPDPPDTRTDPEVVDAAAGARAAELVDLVAEVLDEWGARPPRVLRSGGLAVRDLSRLAASLERGEDELAWLLEVMHAAGLVAAHDPGQAGGRGRGGEEPGWMPTGDSDDWAEEPPHVRWARLAEAWLGMSAAPSLVGPTDSGRVNVLSLDTSWPPGRQRRRDTLGALAAMPTGTAPTVEELVELLRWRHPIRAARGAGDHVPTVLTEAEWAGVTGRGALSSPARALLGDEPEPDAAAAVMAEHLPPPVDHVLLQADLTAIAPGRLDGPARTLLRLVGEVESRGGATVHRISEDGVRRALDQGWSADRLLGELAQVSRTGVPQPLEYLVRDVARRHGVARVGAFSAYVRSDDPALLDQMLNDRRLGMLQLRRIAPTVVVSPVPAATVLDLLREGRYGPVAETGEGEVALAGGHDHRTSRRMPPPVRAAGVDAETAARVVAAMRRGEQGRRQVHGRGTGAPPATDPVVTAGVLREAAADGHPVWIGYADDAGGVRPLLVRPLRVEGGRLRATVAEQDAPRTFLLHRISGARPVE